LCIPLVTLAQGPQNESLGDTPRDPKRDHYELPRFRLLIEWGSKVGVVDRVQGLAMVMPVIQQAWVQQRRWLSVPEKTRGHVLNRAGE